MEKCPAEVWTRILSLACTDGGTTGCAISLVSHYFRDAVLPVQLFSVALLGKSKMASFADLLQRRRPEHRRVQHLCLSKGDTNNRSASTNLPTTDSILYRILITVAPELVSLTSTLAQAGITKDSVLGIPFPSLVELTVHGFFLWPDTPVTAELQGSFPSLRYLHLLSACNSVTLFTKRTPSLTHLRLSATSRVDDTLLRDLENFLADTAPADVDPPTFPPTIQKLFIQYGGPMTRIMVGPGFGNRHQVSSGLRALRSADKHNKLVLLKSENSLGDRYRYRDVRRDWEDRIEGKLGCWNPKYVVEIGRNIALLKI